MIKLRRITQVVSLLFFVFLLSITIYPLALLPGMVDIYLRMSPLHLGATLLNAWVFLAAFIPAIVLLVLTLLLGRFFCGWVCPMGITLDVTDRLLKRKGKKHDDSTEPLPLKPLKYGLLIVILVAAYFEANLAGWFDPQSLITRTYVQVFLPALQYVADLLFRGLYPVEFARPVTTGVHSFFKTTIFALEQQTFHGSMATLLIFTAIALLVFFNRRFWCRFICPMGAILALTSRCSLFKRTVDETKCINCNRCVRNCRMGAIEVGGKTDYKGECIECFTCVEVCPVEAVSFRPVWMRGADTLPVNFTRRTLMISAGAGLLAVPAVRLATGSPARSPIRPPGAGGDFGSDYFMQTCIRCGQCMRVCPTNAIQPTWFDAGVEGLWSPEITPRTGYCEYNCTLCGQVCPTGAIAELAPADKKRRQLGLAAFDRNRCIPWSRNENCLVCEEHCPVPTKAIRFRTEERLNDAGEAVEVKLPYVVEAECIGCSICENVCPVNGRAGVRVTGFMPQTMKEAEAVTAKKSIDALLPESISGWTAAYETDVYGKDNLFAFINGGAEIYYEYGYEEAATRDYEKGEASLTVNIFRMTDTAAAYGIMSYERPRGAAPAGVGQGGYLTRGMLGFHQADHYVKINYYGPGDGGEEMRRAGADVAAGVGAKGARPALLDLVPEGAPAASATFVYGPLTVRGFHNFGEGAIDFAGGVRGVYYTGAAGAPETASEASGGVSSAAAAPRTLRLRLPGGHKLDETRKNIAQSLISNGYAETGDNEFTKNGKRITIGSPDMGVPVIEIQKRGGR